MRALIVSNGEILDYKHLKEKVKDYDYIVGVDGGTNHLIKVEELPDVIIGDLDSINSVNLRYIYKNKVNIVKYPKSKDKTDTELAIDYLIQKNIKTISLMGVMGSRKDHTLANIFLLNKFLKKGLDINIVDENNIIYLVKDKLDISFSKDEFVSIIPFKQDGVIVSLRGFLYNLTYSKIEFCSTLGISNKVLSNKGYISVHEGECFVIVSKD